MKRYGTRRQSLLRTRFHGFSHERFGLPAREPVANNVTEYDGKNPRDCIAEEAASEKSQTNQRVINMYLRICAPREALGLSPRTYRIVTLEETMK